VAKLALEHSKVSINHWLPQNRIRLGSFIVLAGDVGPEIFGNFQIDYLTI
jgi:hypothetical protein